MKKLLIIVLSLGINGCASTHMKQYVGSDIRDVLIHEGKPENVFDYQENRRVFQFYWGGGTVPIPSATTVTGYGTVTNSSVYTTSTAITTGGGEVHSKGCLLSYIAEWNETRNGWIVVDYKYPDRLAC